MKKYLILALVGLLSIACKQSEIQPDPNTWPAGEAIEVALSLKLDQTQTVSRAQQQTTQWQGNGFKVEIATAPINQPHGKAVDDAGVDNVWVLQFDGTDPAAALRYKHYISDYTAGSTIKLFSSATNNRVVVVANSFDTEWADDFIVGSTTWAAVNTASKTVATQNDILPSDGTTEYLPMSGTTSGTLTPGATLDIALTRTVAKVVVKLRSGTDVNATTLDVQLHGVPNTTSWFPNGTGIWPASTTTIDYSEETITGITTTDFVTRTFWVPVNRRGSVDDATNLTRVTKAPLGATYLRAKVSSSIHYTLYLGENLTTDYNLNPNTEYTYSITFQTDPLGNDSQVVDLRKKPGYITQGVAIDGIDVPEGMVYLGQLGDHDNAKYNKGLYLDKKSNDDYGMWSTNYVLMGAYSDFNGLLNTESALTNPINKAAHYCNDKGMYLPAHRQLFEAMSLAQLSTILPAGYDFATSVYYASSTEDRVTFSAQPKNHIVAVMWSLHGLISNITQKAQILKTQGVKVRCVQEF